MKLHRAPRVTPRRGRVAALALGCALSSGAVPALGQSPRCERVITPAAARGYYQSVVGAGSREPCAFAGLRTRASEMDFQWTAGGETLHARVEPAECATPGGAVAGAFAVHADAALGVRCPRTLARLHEALREGPAATVGSPGSATALRSPWARGALGAFGLAVVIALVVGALRGAGSLRERAVRAAALASLLGLPLTLATSVDGLRAVRVDAALAIGALALIASLAARAWPALRGGGIERSTLWTFAGVTATALGARLALRPSLANWYAEVLPSRGEVMSGRFGPGFPVLQAALRATLPWSDRTITLANAVVGAMAAPLTVALAREHGLSRRGAAAAGILVALSPLHARISATPSEHVLSGTLALALLFAWSCAARRGDANWRSLALLLIPCVTLTRAEAWYLAATVPLWGLAAPRNENGPGPTGAQRTLELLPYFAVWALTGAWTWEAVVVPSNHPFPERASALAAARDLAVQFGVLAVQWPRWFPWILPVLGVAGAISMIVSRRALLGCALVTLAVSFLPLGRSFMHDELVGARYFLPTLSVVALAAGVGFAWATAPLVRRRRGAMVAALVALAALAVATTLPAWTVRYTFEDEYAFLRRAAASLPAGCTVYQVQLRDADFERDLDCCLDAPRSPLTIAHSRIRFASLDGDAPAWRATLTSGEGCVAYYQSAACSLQRTPEVLSRHPRTLTALQRRCLAARGAVEMHAVAVGTASARSTNELFGGRRPEIGLWIRARRAAAR